VVVQGRRRGVGYHLLCTSEARKSGETPRWRLPGLDGLGAAGPADWRTLALSPHASDIIRPTAVPSTPRISALAGCLTVKTLLAATAKG